MAGASGDIYLNGLYFKEYCRQNKIEKYAVVGCLKPLKEICGLFEIKQVKMVTDKDVECLQLLQSFLNNSDELINLFKWAYHLNVNRCRLRMTERFDFNDTYRYYIYNFKEIIKPAIPNFNFQNINPVFLLGIVKNKTVIISPYANSVQSLEVKFWKDLADLLKQKDFHVIFNINGDVEKRIEDYLNICYSYTDLVPILEYAGTFIGLRSGLCDIISSAKCKKIILFPEPPKPINYSEHRSDIDFSSLNQMGLCTNAIEISSPLILDITTKGERIDNYYLQSEYDILLNEIMRRLCEVVYD